MTPKRMLFNGRHPQPQKTAGGRVVPRTTAGASCVVVLVRSGDDPHIQDGDSAHGGPGSDLCRQTCSGPESTYLLPSRSDYLLTRYVLVFMDVDIAPGLAWRPPARRGGGSCCRKVSSDPLVATPAADSVAASHNLTLAASVAPRAAAPSVWKSLAHAARTAACWRPCRIDTWPGKDLSFN